MRITFMMPPDDLSGGNRVVATYASILRARGHVVQVVSNAPYRPDLRDALRMMRRGHWRRLWQLMWPEPGHIARSGAPHRVLDRARPITADDLPDADILIATWWETAVWMQAMPPNKGRKVHLIQGYETWAGEDLRDRVQATLQLPNRKIAISAGLKRDIEADLGDLGMVVVSNAVNLKQFDAPARARGNPPTVGFIYALSPIKGADHCLRAIELARQQVPGLQALAFGAEQPIPELPLPPALPFFYRPPQEQIAELYARCDAWLFGSRIESFGLPILEAMACRTPVIGVPVGAAPELLADGVGRLVPLDSAEAMAAEIVALCAMPAADWQNLSTRAYERAHRYSWDDAADCLLQILEEECGKNG